MKDNRKKIIKNISITAGIVLLLIIVIIYTDSTKVSTNNNTATTPNNTSAATEDTTSVMVVPFQVGTGWGYKVLVNGKLFIYQNQIPVISGYHVFATKDQAMEVGSLVADRLRKGQTGMVSKRDLEQLQIIPSDSSSKDHK